jgi:cobalamin biosynthesis protein CbiM
MHVPDGFIDVPVSIGTGAVAVAGMAICLRGARRELDDRTAPLTGLVAAFVFAVQMLNFPIAAGTSGHLLGGTLAAVLVGPYTGALCIAVVLLVQSLFFADGGVTALGTNITDMSLVTVVVGYAVVVLLVRLLPKTRRSLIAATGIGACLSVVAASAAFWVVYVLGGTTDVPLGTVFGAMVGVHLLIGIGEAVITMATVSAVVAVRPDLVRAARHLVPGLELKTRDAVLVEG